MYIFVYIFVISFSIRLFVDKQYLQTYLLKHETITSTKVTCQKIPLQESIVFDMTFKQNVTCYKQKTDIFLVAKPQN